MTPSFLGIDTSNYTTSVAIYREGKIHQAKKLLPVAQGAMGLRQSEAVFAHVKQLGGVLSRALEHPAGLFGVGASIKPRDEEGSYMPCFLVGEMAGCIIAQTHGVPFSRFSHQAGHIAAALYSVNRLDLLEKPFLAFHISGGTTQCLYVRPSEKRIFSIETIAQTMDLNAGQAVDRVGRMLELPFPAGPALEEMAWRSKKQFRIKPTFKGENCCLSGLENQCAKMLMEGAKPDDVALYCITYLEQTIAVMTEKVCAIHPGLPLLYAGGVMSNKLIRESVQRRFGGLFAQPEYSADNAAGIAVLCAYKEENKGGCVC